MVANYGVCAAAAAVCQQICQFVLAAGEMAKFDTTFVGDFYKRRKIGISFRFLCQFIGLRGGRPIE